MFTAGLAFALAAWLVAGVFGDPSMSSFADWAVGLIVGAFGFSLITGIGLGLPRSIRSIDGTDNDPISTENGIALLCFAAALLFAAPAVLAVAA